MKPRKNILEELWNKSSADQKESCEKHARYLIDKGYVKNKFHDVCLQLYWVKFIKKRSDDKIQTDKVQESS